MQISGFSEIENAPRKSVHKEGTQGVPIFVVGGTQGVPIFVVGGVLVVAKTPLLSS